MDGACQRWRNADLVDVQERHGEEYTRKLEEVSPTHHISPSHMALKSTADVDGAATASASGPGPVPAFVSALLKSALS